jgi:HSP20 family protein
MADWRDEPVLIPSKPLNELEELERQFEALFGSSFSSEASKSSPSDQRGWVPAIEVFEKGERFLLKAELPGISREDVSVSTVGDTLTIRGQRKLSAEDKAAQTMALVVPHEKDAFKVYFYGPTKDKVHYFCCYKRRI